MTVKEVQTAKVEGSKKFKVISDGNGLYLRVGRPPAQRRGEASRYWVAKMMYKGRRIEVGLGRFPDLSLAEARLENERLRVEARNGKDPRRRKLTDEENGTP
ncbi:Arm DNA-binding domain-containing protein, partial [Pseudoalteromonas marina]